MLGGAYGIYAQSSGIYTPNLVYELDAGNSSSYAGSGDRWYNLVASPADGSSQSTYDFVQNNSGTLTFHGSPGGMSSNEYWTFSGTNVFSIRGGSGTTFTSSMIHNGAKFTIEMWVRMGTSIGNSMFFELPNAIGNKNLRFDDLDGSEKLEFMVNGGVLSPTGVDTTLSTSTWYQIALSIDENGGSNSFFAVNGAYKLVSGSDFFDANYSTPTTLPTNGPNHGPFGTTLRLAICRLYNTNLSISQLNQNFNIQRSRFGL